MRVLAAFFLLAAAAFAQTAPAPAYQPDYFLAAGASYDYYANTPAGLTLFAAKIADKTYSVTGMDIGTRTGNTAASIRTGVMRLLAQPGNWTLGALGDAGITTVSGVNLGNFSGGGMIAFDVGQALKKDHFYAAILVRMTAITSQQVKPVYEFVLGKTF
jgi:hypothetical protein